MGYVICEKCGGRFELQEGESFTDPQNRRFWDPKNIVFEGFDMCQCGGSLSYVDSINENVEDEQKTFYCPNCGNYENEGIYCSKCVGRLFPVKKYGDINNEAILKIKEEFKKEEINNYPEKMIDRISLTGILFGVVFLIFTSLFIVFSEVGYGASLHSQNEFH